MNNPYLPSGLLGNLTVSRDTRTARASSFDQTGRNRDNWIVMPGEERVLADIEGPGFITHIWMTQSVAHPARPWPDRPGGRRRADAGDPQRARRELGSP